MIHLHAVLRLNGLGDTDPGLVAPPEVFSTQVTSPSPPACRAGEGSSAAPRAAADPGHHATGGRGQGFSGATGRQDHALGHLRRHHWPHHPGSGTARLWG